MPDAKLAVWAVGPLAGWLALATFANLEATLNTVFGRPSPSSEARRAVGLLGAATAATSTVVAASRGSLAFAAAVAWGLGGIAVRNAREHRPGVVIAAGAGLAILASTTMAARRSRSDRLSG